MIEPIDRVVITGASGFVGCVLAARLPSSSRAISFASDDWAARLQETDLAGATIFHLAARAHGPGNDAAFTRDNTDKTRALAQAAAAAGARRLVFLSTIKVNGEETSSRPFKPDDKPAPEDAYARSKWAAERALHEVAQLETVIVRPALVYGPRARANLAALLRLADSAAPLPFASLDARRSFVHVDDLADLLLACASHPAAAQKTYIAAHPQGVSTAQVMTLMRKALGRPLRLFPMPASAIEAASALIGQAGKARRLTRPLLGDPSSALRELQWSPRVPIEDAVEEMVGEYRARRKH